MQDKLSDISLFIKALMFNKCLKHPRYGKICVRILIKLLQEDALLLNLMTDNGLFDYIP